MEIARDEEYPYIYDPENNQTIVPVDENGMLSYLGWGAGSLLIFDGFISVPIIIDLAVEGNFSVLQAAKIIIPQLASVKFVKLPLNLFKIIQRNLYKGKLLDEGDNLIKRIAVKASVAGKLTRGGLFSRLAPFAVWVNIISIPFSSSEIGGLITEEIEAERLKPRSKSSEQESEEFRAREEYFSKVLKERVAKECGLIPKGVVNECELRIMRELRQVKINLNRQYK